MKITTNWHPKILSKISSNFYAILMIFSQFWPPKYLRKSLKNQVWEPLASIWHGFGAARSNLGGFWLAWARFFVDLDEIFGQIFEWVEHGFGEQSLNERYGLIAALNIRFLHSLGCFSLPSGAAGCASRLESSPNTSKIEVQKKLAFFTNFL